MSILPGIYASQITGHLSTNSYESIATVTVGAGGQSSISFSSIPSTFKHLQIRAMGKPASAGGQSINFTFNGDTGANYVAHQLYGNGSSAVSGATTGAVSGQMVYWDNAQFGSAVMDILDYQNTNKYKTARALGGHDLNGSGFILFRSSLWMNTSAVSSINLFASTGDIAQYSSFALYGIRG